MNTLGMLLLLLFVNTCLSAMTDIKEYSEKILNIYRNPLSSTTTKLLMYAFFYLDELFQLEEGVEEEKEACKNFLNQFYSEGGPQHTDNIPWGKFKEELKWTGHDVSEYENVINRTKASWATLEKVHNNVQNTKSRM